jgi:hypothetical protein
MKNETYTVSTKGNLDSEYNPERIRNTSPNEPRKSSNEKSGYVEKLIQRRKISESKPVSRVEIKQIPISKERTKSYEEEEVSKDIVSLKGNLFKALYNINKELNVKIDNKEQSKVVDLNIFLNNHEDSNDTNTYSRKMSKKVDLGVLGSFGDNKGVSRFEDPYDHFTLQNVNNKAENFATFEEDRVRPISDKRVKRFGENDNDTSYDILQNNHVNNIWNEIPENKNTNDGEVDAIKDVFNVIVNEGILDVNNDGEISNFKLNNLIQFINKTIQNDKEYENIISGLRADVASKSYGSGSEYKRLYKDSEQMLKNQQIYIQSVEKENLLLKEQMNSLIKARNKRLLLIKEHLNEHKNMVTELSENFFEGDK